MDVRKAEVSDIDRAVDLVEREGRQLQKFQATFWRRAARARPLTVDLLTRLLDAPDTYFLVAIEGTQFLGFLVARKIANPPAFDPGGDTWLVDDFCVAEPRH